MWTDENRAKYNRDHLRYPSDLTDEEWALVACDAARLDNLDAIRIAAAEAWTKSKPTVLEIRISSQVPPLI